MFLLFVRNTQKWNAMQTFVRKKNQQLQFHWKIIVRDNKDFLIRKHSFSAFAKFSEKLFFTPWYSHVHMKFFQKFPEIFRTSWIITYKYF